MVASIKELEFAYGGFWAIFGHEKHCHNLIDLHIQISALTSTSNVTPEFYLSLSGFCGSMWRMREEDAPSGTAEVPGLKNTVGVTCYMGLISSSWYY